MTAPSSPAPSSVLDLCDLCRALGDPEYAIIADGNASAIDADRQTFRVKASGASLAAVTEQDLVRVHLRAVLDLLDATDAGDELVRQALAAAKRPPLVPAPPSIETVMHAALLELPGVAFVGHTHPTAINALACSTRFEEALAGRIFPEEVVICGPESLLIPYADPGLALGREVRRSAREFFDRHGEIPRAIYLKNHGFIAVGATAREVLNITMTATKAAKIRLGAIAAGGLSLLSHADITRLHRRPDIDYRRRVMTGNP
jgi:rhamnose utilization protein RhaD (predicted bifunctional aldolase and dehydrogenase)